MKNIYSLKPNWRGGGDDVYSQQSVVRNRDAWKTCSFQVLLKHWLSACQWEKSLQLMERQRPSLRAPVVTDEINGSARGRRYPRQAMSPPLHLYNKLNVLVQNAYRISFLVVLMLGTTAHAKDRSVSVNNVQFSSSISSSSTTTLSQEQLAKMYGMDMKQWKQYQTVMKGPRGLWSPNIHPLMALGMREGISESERRKLAKQYATIHYERVKRELAFEHAVFEEGMKKYGHLPLFRENFSASKADKIFKNFAESDSNYRIQYFVNPSCGIKCKTPIQNWIRDGKKLDLFIAGDRKTVASFAKRMGISPLLVPGRITLNSLSFMEMAARGISKNSLPVTRTERMN